MRRVYRNKKEVLHAKHNLRAGPHCLGSQILTRLDNIERGLSVGQNSSADSFLSIGEAAGFLGLSKPTIYAYVSGGKIPVMKRARRLYFSQRDLTEWLHQGRNITLADAGAMADQYLSKKEGKR